MTLYEKAANALNQRLERLQAEMRDAKAESTQRFLFQSLVVTLGISEALNEYIKTVGEQAKRRHGEVKQENGRLAAQHAELLDSAKGLLEKLKTDPTDRAIRKEIEGAQQAMTGIQKALKRGANALQRDVAPSLAMIDKLADLVRRFGEAEATDGLKRVLKTAVEHVRELYTAHPDLPARNIIEAGSWEKTAVAEMDLSTGFADAYALAGYQTILALDLMTMAVSANPPRTAEEATQRANESITARLKSITARFTQE